jgi:hypothetical protein
MKLTFVFLLDIYNSSSIGLATVSFLAFFVNVAITAVISIRGIPSSDATTDDDEIINGN